MPTAEHETILRIRRSGVESFTEALDVALEIKQVPEIDEPGNGYVDIDDVLFDRDVCFAGKHLGDCKGNPR